MTVLAHLFVPEILNPLRHSKPLAVVYLGFVLGLSGCGKLLEHMAESEMSDSQLYDKYVCESGEPTPPMVRRRQDCVNDITFQENLETFKRYRTERDIHLDRD